MRTPWRKALDNVMLPAQPTSRIMASWFTEKRSGSRGTMFLRAWGRQWRYLVLQYVTCLDILAIVKYVKTGLVISANLCMFPCSSEHIFASADGTCSLHTPGGNSTCLARYCPSAPLRAGHRGSTEFAIIPPIPGGFKWTIATLLGFLTVKVTFV